MYKHSNIVYTHEYQIRLYIFVTEPMCSIPFYPKTHADDDTR